MTNTDNDIKVDNKVKQEIELDGETFFFVKDLQI